MANGIVKHWHIEDAQTLTLIETYGFNYIHTGNNWYDSDIPISPNGTYQNIRSLGTELTTLTDEQIEAQKLQEFNKKVQEKRKHASLNA